MIHLMVSRNGEVIESDCIAGGKAMDAAYLRRIVDAAKPNVANYITLDTAQRDAKFMRSVLFQIAEKRGITIKTFTYGDFLAFVVCKPESVFI